MSPHKNKKYITSLRISSSERRGRVEEARSPSTGSDLMTHKSKMSSMFSEETLETSGGEPREAAPSCSVTCSVFCCRLLLFLFSHPLFNRPRLRGARVQLPATSERLTEPLCGRYRRWCVQGALVRSGSLLGHFEKWIRPRTIFLSLSLSSHGPQIGKTIFY